MGKRPNNSRREPIFPESQVAVVTLTRGYITIIDAEDWQRVSRYKWSVCGSRGCIYARSSVNHIWLHRLINNTPKGKETDHINRITLDNRKCNLRVCTKSQNKRNTPPNVGSSRYKGVRRITSSGRWRARAVSPEGKRKHLGVFDTEMEAAKAYDDYIRKIAPEFGYLNFPED